MRLILKMPFYWSFRNMGKPLMLPFNYTFSISYRCNSRCKTCNIWKIQKKVKREDELTTEEWISIIRSLCDTPFWITLSGGEPMLRSDILELVEAINRYNKPAIINIPTNGLVKETASIIEDILREINKKTLLVINFSLDGIGEENDSIRGIRGGWRRTVESYVSTKSLKEKYDNLVVGIHTVISRWNVKRIPQIASYLIEQFQPDQYITEIAEERYEMENFENKPTPKAGDYARAIEFLITKIREEMKEGKWRGLARITEAFRIEYYRYVRDLYFKKNNGMKSFAGFATCQISPVGDVWECAVYASKMGNLRDFDYDFKKLWKSDKAWRVREIIRRGHACPLANECYVNMIFNLKTLLNVLKNYIF